MFPWSNGLPGGLFRWSGWLDSTREFGKGMKVATGTSDGRAARSRNRCGVWVRIGIDTLHGKDGFKPSSHAHVFLYLDLPAVRDFYLFI